MAEPMDRTDGPALWQRWRSASMGGPQGIAPDALMLAGYVEDRLSPDAAAAVEEWLAANPDAIGDLLAAREAASAAPPEAPEGVIARAAALLNAGDAHVLSFSAARKRQVGWRVIVARGGIAASLLIASLVGFVMGNDAYVSVASAASSEPARDLIDPPGGFFSSLDEEPNL
jgi:hypothetical protein